MYSPWASWIVSETNYECRHARRQKSRVCARKGVAGVLPDAGWKWRGTQVRCGYSAIPRGRAREVVVLAAAAATVWQRGRQPGEQKRLRELLFCR